MTAAGQWPVWGHPEASSPTSGPGLGLPGHFSLVLTGNHPHLTCTHTRADLRWTVNWAAEAPEESVPRAAVTSGTAFPTLA